MASKLLTLLQNSVFIFIKDVRLEFRTRYAVNAMILFAITTLTAISFSLGPVRLDPNLVSSLLWILLFFSSMSSLSHIFVREEEQQTSDTLRLISGPIPIFLGKWLFNVVLILCLEIIIVPLFFILLNASVQGMSIFIVVLILGSIGLATVSTVIAAIISQASVKGALFAVLAFPISLPILISSINGTRLSIEGNNFSESMDDIQALFSFLVVIFTVSLLVFEFIWKK